MKPAAYCSLATEYEKHSVEGVWCAAMIGGAVLVLLTMAVNSLDKIEDAMSLFRSDIAVLKVQNSILKDDLKAHRNDKRSHQ